MKSLRVNPVRHAARVFRAQLPDGSRTSRIPDDREAAEPRNWTPIYGRLRYALPGEPELSHVLTITRTGLGWTDAIHYVDRDGGFGGTTADDTRAGATLTDKVADLMTRAARIVAEDAAEAAVTPTAPAESAN